MTEQPEFGNKLNDYIDGLKKQAVGLRDTASNYDLQVDYLVKQEEIFEQYGAKLPLATATIKFIVEQIAAASNPPADDKGKTLLIRSSTRPIALKRRTTGQKSVYNIAGPAKPIMNSIFGRGKEDVPRDLESLFNGMYGNDWQSKTINVPTGPGKPHMTRTFLEDLRSDDGYIKILIESADEVIARKMRKSTPPLFPYRRKTAAVELVQLYNKIDAIGWNVYDDFMVRNSIRQPKIS